MEQPNIVCVVGPTACGKTRMGVLLAKALGGEVVSVDSMQIYRRLTVGTAAPTPEEMEGVPHHMVAVADVGESWSAARFVEEAHRCIRDILDRHRLPILVGGTGLYLDAIVSGRDFAPGKAGGEIRQALQRELEEEGEEALRRALEAVDPESARRVLPGDTRRLIRALEVYRETGETITAHNEATRRRPPRYRAAWIGLAFRDRADMKALIDRRVDAMLENGLWEEARWLMDQDLPPDATALQAIGYKEVIPCLRGEITAEQAAAELKLRSRQYAKRQLTWLRRNQAIHWILWDKTRDFDKALQDATEYLAAHGLG